MKRATLAHARAHLSELVDKAEIHGERTVISRRGRPAAVLVPVSVGLPVRRMTSDEFQALLDSASRWDDPSYSAVDDLIRGRR